MRLCRIQQYLSNRGLPFQYCEQEGLGSIDFEYRGIGYHIWEFCQEHSFGEAVQYGSAADESALQYGAESNLKNGGRMDEYLDDYEQNLIDEMESWR